MLPRSAVPLQPTDDDKRERLVRDSPQKAREGALPKSADALSATATRFAQE